MVCRLLPGFHGVYMVSPRLPGEVAGAGNWNMPFARPGASVRVDLCARQLCSTPA